MEINFGGSTNNVQVKNGQSVIGLNQGGMHQSTGNDKMSPYADLFDKLREVAPQEAVQDIGKIEELVAAELEAPPEKKPGFLDRARPYLEAISPYAPTIAAGALGFGTGFLRKFIEQGPVSPIVNGVVEMLEAVRAA